MIPESSQLRVGHAERDETIEVLSASAADGRLTVDELTERIDAAAQARTYADLEALVTDLPVTLSWQQHQPGGTSVPALPGTPGKSIAIPAAGGQAQPTRPGYAPEDPLLLKAGWDNVKRQGAWEPPPFIKAHPKGANVKLDFLDVEKAPELITVQVAAGSGKLTIVVPEEWGVNHARLDYSSLASFKSSVREASLPGFPQIVLTGKIGWGSGVARKRQWWDSPSFGL